MGVAVIWRFTANGCCAKALIVWRLGCCPHGVVVLRVGAQPGKQRDLVAAFDGSGQFLGKARGVIADADRISCAAPFDDGAGIGDLLEEQALGRDVLSGALANGCGLAGTSNESGQS